MTEMRNYTYQLLDMKMKQFYSINRKWFDKRMTMGKEQGKKLLDMVMDIELDIDAIEQELRKEKFNPLAKAGKP